MPLSDYSHQISELAQADLLRTRRVVAGVQDASMVIDGQRVFSFASNDYLGLANHPKVVEATMRGLKRYGLGAAASHMVTGHHEAHEALEEKLATFLNLPKALLFSSGYAANLGILTALAGRGDVIFADKLNHACLNDGALLSRAEFKRYPHNDVAKLRVLLESWADKGNTGARKIIATDAVFSMDGDIAPLPELLELAEEFDAMLVVDDAHGFGVLGYRGKGALEHCNLKSDRIVYMATLGKAAGGYGAFVAGHADVIEWIMQSARTYLFSTATPPAIAAGMMAALDVMASDHERRKHLRILIDFFSDSLKLHYAKLPFSQTAIQPIIVGDNATALAFAEALRERHFLVPAIRPPTVPPGTARLRVSLNANHVVDDVFDLVTAMTDLDVTLLGGKRGGA